MGVKMRVSFSPRMFVIDICFEANIGFLRQKNSFFEHGNRVQRVFEKVFDRLFY